MKTEVWNGHQIRFIEKDDEWWAVLTDVADALGLDKRNARRGLPDRGLISHPIKNKKGRMIPMNLVNELGIYALIFKSRTRKAKQFQEWIYTVIKELRESTGLEGFEAFRMLDKEHQKEAMQKLKEGLKPNGKVSYIKANTIANKAVSNRHGYDKMVKKKDMTPGMLRDRQAILDDTVELMTVNEKFGLNLSVAEEVYKRWDA